MMIMSEFMPGGSLTDLFYGGYETTFTVWRATQVRDWSGQVGMGDVR